MIRLFLDDALATAPYVVPLTAGWIEPPAAAVDLQPRPRLTGPDVGAEDAALVPIGEIPSLQQTHRVAPDAAIVFGDVGTVAMRCPVRPDEIEATPVRLWETSGTGRFLARATLQPFYGIKPIRWTSTDDAAAQVVIVEGPEALRVPEAGFAEDLCRAWFILTGESAVGHVLVVPKTAERGDLAPLFAALAELRATGHAKRRDLRQSIVEAHDLPPERVLALFGRMRLTLDPPDRRSLPALLHRGHPGGDLPAVRAMEYLEPED